MVWQEDWLGALGTLRSTIPHGIYSQAPMFAEFDGIIVTADAHISRRESSYYPRKEMH